MNKEIEFLEESNKIEREYSKEALEDAKHAWNLAKKHKHHRMSRIMIELIHSELMRRLNPRIAGKIRDCRVYIDLFAGQADQKSGTKVKYYCHLH